MSARGSARLLVVDDDPSVLATLAAILAQEGYQMVAASGAEEALGHLRDGPFHLVLTDLRMEGESGLSLLAELRRHWPETMAIMLTGYASLESAIDALRHGAYDYLIKPCNVEELKATVARAIDRGALAQALAERLTELDVANRELRALSEDLQARVLQATAELSQKVDELSAAKRQLEEAQHQRAEFISTIAHELKAPMTTIVGYAQLLSHGSSSPERQQRACGMIVAQTQRLTRLVQDLAAVANLAAGHFQVRPVACDLVQVVREQVEMAQLTAEHHTITLHVAHDTLTAECDRDRIAQVLTNLLANAVKYTPGGRVEVHLRAESAEALLSVSDERPGIPPEQRESIFVPYVRLLAGERASPASGSGLGLYIARGIAHAHGGRLWVEDAPAGGGRFVLALPLVAACAAEHLAEPPLER